MKINNLLRLLASFEEFGVISGLQSAMKFQNLTYFAQMTTLLM